MTREGSPTSHGHNSLTVRSYVTFHIPPKMERHVISIQNSLTFKYIKTHTTIHQTNVGPLPKPLCYWNSQPDFLQGLKTMKTNLNNQNVGGRPPILTGSHTDFILAVSFLILVVFSGFLGPELLGLF
jgi:hypothetical protein